VDASVIRQRGSCAGDDHNVTNPRRSDGVRCYVGVERGAVHISIEAMAGCRDTRLLRDCAHYRLAEYMGGD
jgi:hypothetical protein